MTSLWDTKLTYLTRRILFLLRTLPYCYNNDILDKHLTPKVLLYEDLLSALVELTSLWNTHKVPSRQKSVGSSWLPRSSTTSEQSAIYHETWSNNKQRTNVILRCSEVNNMQIYPRRLLIGKAAPSLWLATDGDWRNTDLEKPRSRRNTYRNCVSSSVIYLGPVSDVSEWLWRIECQILSGFQAKRDRQILNFNSSKIVQKVQRRS